MACWGIGRARGEAAELGRFIAEETGNLGKVVKFSGAKPE